MEVEAIRNPYNKSMPGGPEDSNGFQWRHVRYGQQGDVYRHILFVAGTILAGDSNIRNRFIGYDEKQARAGRRESVTELENDRSAIKIGNLMDQAWRGKSSPERLEGEIYRELCN
jgi:hypothetical protein